MRRMVLVRCTFRCAQRHVFPGNAPCLVVPAELRGHTVPEVLRSGDHGRIARWRHAQSLVRTMQRRPDLITARGGLSDADRALLREFGLDDAMATEAGPR